MNFKSESGNIFITVLFVVLLLTSLNIFLFKIFDFNINNTVVKKNIRNEKLIIKSCELIIINIIKDNFAYIINNKKFTLDDLIKINVNNNYFSYNLIWYKYPEILKINMNIYDEKKDVKFKKNITKYIKIQSLFIYDIVCPENVIIDNNPDTMLIIKTPFINKKDDENLKIFSEDYLKSYNDFNLIFPDLNKYNKYADIEIKESYIANQKFKNKTIFKKGDLTIKNCFFDTCTLIVTGNLTIEGKCRFSPNPKNILNLSNKLIIQSNIKKIEPFFKENIYLDLLQRENKENYKSVSILCAKECFVNILSDKTNIMQGILVCNEKFILKKNKIGKFKLFSNKFVLK